MQAMNFIKPNMKYTETLTFFKATTLHEMRTHLCQRYLQGILSLKHKLHYLLVDARIVLIDLRKPKIKTQSKT